MNITPKFAAGDTVTWLDDPFTGPNNLAITSATYTLTYSLRGPVAGLDVVATANGAGWQTSLTPTQTAALNATTAFVIWFWQAYAAAGGARYLAGQGQIRVDPNLAALSTSATYDGRTYEEVTLSAINAEISARISGGASVKYTIGNRSLEKEPLDKLLALKSRFELMVARQKARDAVANGQGNPSKTFIRFGPRR